MADHKVDQILTLKELAKYLRCHTSTLYRLVKTGEIPPLCSNDSCEGR